MSVILILILASLAMALLFLGSFIWAVRSGQFEDTLTPGMRVLADENYSAALHKTPAPGTPRSRGSTGASEPQDGASNNSPKPSDQ